MARPSDLPLPTSEFRLSSQCTWSEPQCTCSLLSFRHDADSPANSVASYPLTRYAPSMKKAKSKCHGSASQPFFAWSRNAPLPKRLLRVTRLWGGVLRDNTKNGREAD